MTCGRVYAGVLATACVYCLTLGNVCRCVELGRGCGDELYVAVLCCRWQWARALRLGLGLIGVGEHGQRMAVSLAVGVRGGAVRDGTAAEGGRAGGGCCLAGGRQSGQVGGDAVRVRGW